MHWIDPHSLTPVNARVRCFLFNPHGEADGMLLDDGTELHLPPHLSGQLLKHVGVGDDVIAYGVKPRGVDMLSCIAIENDAGKRIEDTGPPAGHKKRKPEPAKTKPAEVVGVLERVLHGPKGEVRGGLLEGGCQIRFPPHAASAGKRLLEPGLKIAVQGDSHRAAGAGTVIIVRAWGRMLRTLKPLPHKPPK